MIDSLHLAFCKTAVIVVNIQLTFAVDVRLFSPGVIAAVRIFNSSLVVFLFAALGLQFTVSCRAAHFLPSTNTANLKIYGGSPVSPNEHTGIVALLDRRGDLVCTGTLIHPEIVITAGHCLESASPDDDIFGIHVGLGNDQGHYSTSTRVRSFSRHPLFHNHPRGNMDVGLLFLEQPVKKTEAEPVALTTSPEKVRTYFKQSPLPQSEPVELVGYGQREDGGKGIKYKVETPVIQANTSEILTGGQGKDACSGDSGGPVLTADGRLLAVISRGASIACGNGGIATMVADAGCWIQNEAATQKIFFPVDQPCGDRRKQFDSLSAALAGSGHEFTDDVRNLNLSELNLSDWFLESIDGLPQLLEGKYSGACTRQPCKLNLKGNHLKSIDGILALPGLVALDIAFNNIGKIEIESAADRGIVVSGGHLQINNFLNTTFMKFCKPFDEIQVNSPSNSPDTPAEINQLLALRARFFSNNCDTINRKLVKTTRLNLKNRDLTSISLLADLPLLRDLEISGNPISDYSALLTLERLTNVNITNNPNLTSEPQSQVFNELQKRGVTIIGIPPNREQEQEQE